jgi:hypothetical protein
MCSNKNNDNDQSTPIVAPMNRKLLSFDPPAIVSSIEGECRNLQDRVKPFSKIYYDVDPAPTLTLHLAKCYRYCS